MIGMEFIGRDNEMKILNKEYERKSSFVLITGRRRIGKTRLIKEFISDKEAIYFLTSNQTENLILRTVLAYI
jgi:AAA+ ATPase superfamily predicted ATPase